MGSDAYCWTVQLLLRVAVDRLGIVNESAFRKLEDLVYYAITLLEYRCI